MIEFMRLGAVGTEIPVARDGDAVYDLRGLTADIDGAFFEAGGIARARQAVAAGELPRVEGWEALRVGAPVARPSAVICIGMNYAEHAAESGSEPPENPVVFMKTPNTVVGPADEVFLPPNAEKVDWEVELAVVIGRRARYLSSPAEARDYIAGFTISNDVSERAFQIEHSGGQWSKGKCSETFNPLGPALVPADDLDYQNLKLGSRVNGGERQNSTTADMIFPVDLLIYHLSQYLVLEPGDIVNTGTPKGVALSGNFPYLAAGDEMTMWIEGLGEQTQRVVPAPGV